MRKHSVEPKFAEWSGKEERKELKEGFNVSASQNASHYPTWQIVCKNMHMYKRCIVPSPVLIKYEMHISWFGLNIFYFMSHERDWAEHRRCVIAFSHTIVTHVLDIRLQQKHSCNTFTQMSPVQYHTFRTITTTIHSWSQIPISKHTHKVLLIRCYNKKSFSVINKIMHIMYYHSSVIIEHTYNRTYHYHHTAKL